MSPPQPSQRYDRVSQFLHWLTAVLVLVAFIYGPGGSEARVYAPSRDFERQLHESLGLSVFFLTLVRSCWKLFGARAVRFDIPGWMDLSARAVQGALYVLLFAVPLTAITGAWLEGHPLTLLAGIEIAPPLAQAHAAGAWFAELHGWLGDTILWLAGLHAVAAIYHHFFLKDGVLVSMLGGRSGP